MSRLNALASTPEAADLTEAVGHSVGTSSTLAELVITVVAIVLAAGISALTYMRPKRGMERDAR